MTVQTVAQRTYPQGGTTATHVLGYVGDITSSYLAAHPERWLHPGQPDRRLGDRGRSTSRI